ncbi:hypothetical protein [uncultured Draconibacterium sp.]|uniref:putative quinol monooxygenase n=1 Tax=uncultured Draconibacterium sp. TaxID=1573823 RepID=UPI003216A126
MKQIHLTAKFNINDGKIEEFKSIASKCVAAVSKNEKGKGSLQYEWFFSKDDKECHVLETYLNSEAFMGHMGNVGELLGQLLQISTLSGDIYGDVSDEVKSALNGLDVKSYSFFMKS